MFTQESPYEKCLSREVVRERKLDSMCVAGNTTNCPPYEIHLSHREFVG